MLQTFKNLRKFRLHALDGLLGNVKDCYFDDEKWTVRYLVIHTGSWMMGRDVLISPIAIKGVDREEKAILVSLTREAVEKSPTIDTAQPISRQDEREYFQYFGWPYYWGGPAVWGWSGVPEPFPIIEPPDLPTDEHDDADVHLRSAEEIVGYHIQTSDGAIGHLEDFVINNTTWSITDLLIDTRNWWPGKKVLIPHATVHAVSWLDRSLTVDLSREQIEQAPEYDSDKGLTEEYQRQVNEYYAHLTAAVR